MKSFKLTTKEISEIKEAALKRFITDSPNAREQDLFVSTCYVKSTLDYLVRNGIIKYTEDDKIFPYEPTDE